MEIEHQSYIGHLSDLIGSSVPALRLLLSLLIGYPFIVFHRYTLHGKHPALQHLFFTACGMWIGYFNYGSDVLHSLFCVIVLYLTLIMFGGTLASVIVSFVFQMGYLIAAYYYTGSETYDIKWSMPHCVLTLRLIALSFDFYDGMKSKEERTPDQEKTALFSTPSLLEVLGQVYFPGGFMVGPQFTMRRYLDFVHGRFVDKEDHSSEKLPPCLVPGFLRGLMGLLVLALFQIASQFVNDELILSDEMMLYPFWKRMIYSGVWATLGLHKYISCWLLAEGVCIAAGLSYNGKDENGNILWNGCANVKLRFFEKSTCFGHIIMSFNINTNTWVAQYVYKRLKFLGNKAVSQAATLLFLAVWHGLHSGYYICFFMEFIVMKFEKEFESMLSKHPSLVRRLNSGKLQYIKIVLMKLYLHLFLGWCMAPFYLLTYSRWAHVYNNVLCYSGYIMFGGWVLYAPLVSKLLQSLSDDKQERKKGQ